MIKRSRSSSFLDINWLSAAVSGPADEELGIVRLLVSPCSQASRVQGSSGGPFDRSQRRKRNKRRKKSKQKKKKTKNRIKSLEAILEMLCFNDVSLSGSMHHATEWGKVIVSSRQKES